MPPSYVFAAALAAFASPAIVGAAATTVSSAREPVVSHALTLQHAVVPLSSLAPAAGAPATQPNYASAVWRRKADLVVAAYAPLGLPGSPMAPRVWEGSVAVAPTATAVATAESVSLASSNDQMYLVRLVDAAAGVDLVRAYPACLVSDIDSVRVHLDELGTLYSFDWLSNSRGDACGGSGTAAEPKKVTIAPETRSVTVTTPIELPRPLKPVEEEKAKKKAAKAKKQAPKLTAASKITTPAGSAAAATEAAAPNADIPVGEDKSSVAEEEEVEEGDLDADQRADDKKSFLAKYWMYLLPVGLMLLTGGGGGGDKEKEGGAAAKK
ncbi:hypothetical protein BC828DRAFT_378387 [Blastocladiella britannica]|nr:hypothetical protein BC828DRAFT_378387 [Blastocladiella britannica]